jgi:hypothetical protein
MSARELLIRSIHARADGQAAAWLDAAVARVQTGSRDALLEAYTLASTKLGAVPLDLRMTDLDAAAAAKPGTAVLALDAARLAVLLARADAIADPDAFFADACACYEQGDAGEQRSWLRGVRLLPGPERFLALVIDACRTNILPNFEAVACENPYPARYFPERNFNQLVLKALFNNVAIARIVGLGERANPELARMAGDYAAERRAAGRPVPGDIELAMVSAAG